MCRLSLAWVTSENSTMLLESDSSWLTVAGPYPMLPHFSAVRCWLPLSVLSPNCLLLLASLLSCHQLPLGSSHQLSLSCPTTNCLYLGRVVNSRSRPLTTSGYGEISCPRILCLVSRKNRQLNRLLWQPTPIVLHLPIFSLFLWVSFYNPVERQSRLDCMFFFSW